MRALMGSQVEFEAPPVGGLSVRAWHDLYDGCTEADGFGGLRLRAWPDGQPYVEQPSVTVEMFGVFEQEFMKGVERERARHGK